ncbi:SURF1 family protein [Streptomyces sp. YIM 130001]|uniref:SURF1 family protein n=1 Tax=Streptomyces sp. YIM 130001 TaxID=2259644 RepID=UPI000E655F91|nr:SURF1 family protein [Streptomyces sp. YIM 130001]RII09186.1 SURF1 family protein [Streptomyces sp. YIM 130001]
MYRFLLTPRWWGINVFLVLAIPFCIFMGSWQLGRFEDRVDTHQEAEQQSRSAGKGASAPLAELLPVSQDTSGRRATASGTWDRQLLVPDRMLDDRDGYYVLGLLRTEGPGEGKGKVLPVVRGWLPGDAAAGKAPALPGGEVEVTGALQASESAGSNGVSDRAGLPKGQLAVISAASLVNLVPYDVEDAWVTSEKATDGMRPVPPKVAQGSGLDLKAFQNLGYTGEWFIFAGFVLFMWFRLFRRELEFARDAELGLLGADAQQQEPTDAEDATDTDDAEGSESSEDAAASVAAPTTRP